MLHCREQGQTGAGTGIEDITHNITCLFFGLKLCLVSTFDMLFSLSTVDMIQTVNCLVGRSYFRNS